MSRIDFEPGRSKKEQVAENLRERIATGNLNVGDSLGDVFKMADDYGVSHGTVRDAQRMLVDEGLLSEIKIGMPTRVIDMPRQSSVGSALQKLRTLRREIDDVIRQLEKVQ